MLVNLIVYLIVDLWSLLVSISIGVVAHISNLLETKFTFEVGLWIFVMSQSKNKKSLFKYIIREPRLITNSPSGFRKLCLIW